MTRKVENATVSVSEPKKVPASKKGTSNTLVVKRNHNGTEIDCNLSMSVASNGQIVITLNPDRTLYQTDKGNYTIATTKGIIEFNGIQFNINAFVKA